MADPRASGSERQDHGAFLSEAGRVLFSSLDYEATLRRVVHLAVPRLADWCGIDVLESGEIRRLAVAHRDPEKEVLALEVSRRYPADPEAKAGVARVLRTGEPEILSSITDAVLREAAQDEEHLRMLRSLELRSGIIVPLVAHGRILGDLVFASETENRYTEADLPLAQDLALYAALAIDNARLYRETEESRALLDAFFDAAPVAVGFVDRDLRYRRINRTLAAIDGVRPEEAIGRELREVVPEFAPRIEPLYRHVLRTGETIREREVSGPHPSNPGSFGHFLVNYFPVQVDGREPLGVGLVALDITERKRVEDRERLFSQVLEDSRNEIYLFDAETLRFVRVNRGARENLGYTMEELESLTPLDLKPEFTQETFERLVRPLREGSEEVVRFETVHRRKDGSLYPVDVHLQLSHAGDRPLFAALILDVTERREAERAVRQSAAQFRTLANTIPQLAWIADEEGSIFWYNQRWYDYTGTTPEEMVGWGWRKVHHPDEVERVVARFRRAVTTGEPWEDTFPLRSRTGEYRWFLSRALPLQDEGGRVMRWFGTNTDITEQREAEQERERLLAAAEHARAEAEAANRAKTDFLSAMSHELRTPLNAIAGYVDLLDVGVHGELSPEQRRDVLRIKRSQEVLLSLISDLLNFAKLEAGKLEIECEPLPVDAVLADLATLVDPQVREKGLTFDCAPAAPGVRVWCDPERVRQVLLNLLTNATKFTDTGGSIRVDTTAGPGWVHIAVSDTGWGIDPERLQTVFDPFVQLDRSRHEASQKGVGLGLAISRELARSMEGDLTVESTPGIGSTFTLTLRRVEG